MSAKATTTRAVAAERPEFFYESIAERFETLDHPADIRRRLRLVFDECLAHTDLRGKRVLDAGCGYGAFSAAAAHRGGSVVSVDIGIGLVTRTMARASTRGFVGDACCLAVHDESFDIVVSSEMLEHTPAPRRVVEELARILRPGGLLVVTTPNRVWQTPVHAASRLALRPFHGLENFVGWRDMDAVCAAAGLDVLDHVGFHPWPFQLGLQRAATVIERRLARSRLARFMVNQAVVARKRAVRGT